MMDHQVALANLAAELENARANGLVDARHKVDFGIAAE